MKLQELTIGQSLSGIELGQAVTVAAVTPHGSEAVQLIYKTANGDLKERLLGRQDEQGISLATTEAPFQFDGDGGDFQLACEAKRIDLAFLFDPMMAVHTANVEPLPHQITAVYESLLPRQPLRYVLADDPGAGKTIMAGLYISELILRADAQRVLIVAPGSLVEQWRDELFEKFGLEFTVWAPVLDAGTGDTFERYDRLIVRLDQASRNETLSDRICATGWDLVVFDEAHKLSAHYYGAKEEKTARFRFAERVGLSTRHLLLMTATPHNGKEEDFQLFLSLLDSDRFYGKFRDGAHRVDTTDLMRRMIKEELVKFDGTPLFPERRAYTVNYALSEPEAELYQSVTQYVQTEMGKAEKLEGKRKGSVGFALTALQRRLASSPEAIFQSLKRRRKRLEDRLREEALLQRGRRPLAEVCDDIPEDFDADDLTAAEQEDFEDTLVDQASAAQSALELAAEIEILKGLELQAQGLVASGQDRKWDELSKILQHSPQMLDANGRPRKIIIFSEHRDTLNFLQHKITGLLGNPEAILTIHGGTNRDDRRKRQALFRSDPEVRVLIATDAAGEGVNLQHANLMVNYDLPWNPNRLEQRFGRIHRIGQMEVCHLWNLVAHETREGAVYQRLLDKLDVASRALKGRVFDVLGEVFDGTNLKDLMIEAIRYGDRPEVRAKLHQKIDNALNREHIEQILTRNSLAQETMTPERLFAVKEEMEKAEARRLQPYFVRSFFLKAFEHLQGARHAKGYGRYEIAHVPALLRERDRRITGRNRREQEPVLRRYESICFERSAIRPAEKPSLPRAELMHPGHPLMPAITDVILEKHANLLRRGTVLRDPCDPGTIPWLLLLLSHEVRSGDGVTLSKRIQFVRVDPDGDSSFAGWAPHLDLTPITPGDRLLLADTLQAPWLTGNPEARALALAASTLVPEHYHEVAGRRIAHVDKTLVAVHERLTREIDFWQDRWQKLRDDQDAGKDVRLNLENTRQKLQDMQHRLDKRKAELTRMRQVVNGTPVVIGGALVVPDGLLRTLRYEDSPTETAAGGADAAARARIERLAMDAVRRAEEARGCRVVDVSSLKCGWDLTSYPAPGASGLVREPRHIEVKGRIQGATTVTITHNELLYACNQGSKFILAIVIVADNGETQAPYYVRNIADREPPWGVESVNYNLDDLIARAEPE